MILTKRRGQGKKPIIDMVQLLINEFLPKMPTREDKYNLLQTVRDASDGKMFLEREYA